MKLCIIILVALGILFFSAKYYLSNNEPQIEIISQFKDLSHKNNKPPRLTNSNSSSDTTSSSSVKIDADIEVVSSQLPPKTRSIPEDQLLFENPDDFATSLTESSDDRVINIGKYIPVLTEGDDLEQSEPYRPEDVVNIGEYIPIDDEDLLQAKKEYEEYKAQNPEQVTDIDEELLMLEEANNNESEATVTIGEYIPVDADLPN